MSFFDDMPEVLARLIDSDLSPLQKCFSFIREGILLGYLKKEQRIVERELVDLLKIIGCSAIYGAPMGGGRAESMPN